MAQHIIVATIVAACISYAAFRLFKALKKAKSCKDYRCSGCAFYEKCKEHKKSKLKKSI